MKPLFFKVKAVVRAIALLLYSPVWVVAHLLYFIARVLLMIAYFFMLEGKKANDIRKHLL